MSLGGRYQFKQKHSLENKSFEKSGRANDERSNESSSSFEKRLRTSDTVEVVLLIKGSERDRELDQMKNFESNGDDEVFEEASQDWPSQRQRKKKRQISVTFHDDCQNTEHEPASRQNSSAPLVRKQKNSECDSTNVKEYINEELWCQKSNFWYIITALCISVSVLSVCLTVFYVHVAAKDSQRSNATTKDLYGDGVIKTETETMPLEVNFTGQMYGMHKTHAATVLVLIGGESAERIVSSVEIYPKDQFPSCSLPSLPKRLKWGNAGFVNNNLLVCGGVGPESKLNCACWALDATSQQWRSLDNLTR